MIVVECSDQNGPYPKMDPIVKQLWVDALRSGEYVQTCWVLRQYSTLGVYEDKHCIFGVLVDLWLRYAKPNVDSGLIFSSPYPCNEVLEWAGLPTIDKIVHKPSHTITTTKFPRVIKVIIDMNDTGVSFDDLAKFIDGNL